MSSLISDMVTRVQQRADRVDPGFRTRTVDALDEALQWAAASLPWDALRKTETMLANGTAALVMPDRINTVISLFDRTNSRPILSGNDWEKRVSGAYSQATAGAAAEWRDGGMEPVIAQPSTDTVLSFQTAVSDGMSVVVRGLCRDTGASGTAMELYEVEEEITLGSSASAFSSTNAFVRVMSIQKDKDTLSDVKIRNIQSGATISRIPKWATRPMFRRVELLFVPAAGTQIDVTYFRRPDRIVSENGAFDAAANEEAIIWRAAGNLLYYQNEGDAAQRAWQKAEELIALHRNQEQTHGERYHTVDMDFSYFQTEGLGEDISW